MQNRSIPVLPQFSQVIKSLGERERWQAAGGGSGQLRAGPGLGLTAERSGAPSGKRCQGFGLLALDWNRTFVFGKQISAWTIVKGRKYFVG